MSLTNDEILAFVKENIVLKEIDGKIGIKLIRTDVDAVIGHVGVAESVGTVITCVDSVKGWVKETAS